MWCNILCILCAHNNGKKQQQCSDNHEWIKNDYNKVYMVQANHLEYNHVHVGYTVSDYRCDNLWNYY